MRVEDVWVDPDEVCELGVVGLLRPVDPPARDWLSVVVAVILPVFAEVEASGVLADVPSGVVD